MSSIDHPYSISDTVSQKPLTDDVIHFRCLRTSEVLAMGLMLSLDLPRGTIHKNDVQADVYFAGQIPDS
jgi:hypothetical protein